MFTKTRVIARECFKKKNKKKQQTDQGFSHQSPPTHCKSAYQQWSYKT